MNFKKLIKKTKKATVGNKNFRKAALVVGTAVAAYYTGGAALSIAKKQAEKDAKRRQNAKLRKMYSGTSQAEGALDRTDTGDADMVDKLYRTGAGGAVMGAPVACGATGGDPMMFVGTVLFGAVLGLFLYWRQRHERL